METVSFPENIDWYLLFLAKASYYKGKSWRVIDGSIQPGESKPTVFGAAKPGRQGGKFSNTGGFKSRHQAEGEKFTVFRKNCLSIRDFWLTVFSLSNYFYSVTNFRIWKSWPWKSKKFQVIFTIISMHWFELWRIKNVLMLRSWNLKRKGGEIFLPLGQL